jgi:predicted transposase/invertase (TIGR01784 family)
MPFTPSPTDSLSPLTLANDLLFKTLFTRQPHLLADLINAVRHDQPPVQVLDILNPSIPPETPSHKQIVLDILARDASGTLYNVEMQVRHLSYWPERNIYYVAKALGEQLNKGESYDQLKPAIGISLLVGDLYPEHPECACWCFALLDRQHPDVQLSQALEMHIVELSKAERLRGFSTQLPPELFAWITCLLHAPHEDIMSQINHPPAQEAMRHLETMLSDEQLRHDAFYRRMGEIEGKIWLRKAEEFGMRNGREEGLAEGRSEGRSEGKAALLLQQLTHKFGPLSSDAKERITSASVENLDAWALNLLQASTLEQVFQGS